MRKVLGSILPHELGRPRTFWSSGAPGWEVQALGGMPALTKDRSRRGPDISSFILSCLSLLLYFKWFDSDPSSISSCVMDGSCHFLKLALALGSGVGLMRWCGQQWGKWAQIIMTRSLAPGQATYSNSV